MTAELELTSPARILAGTRSDITVKVTKDGAPATPTGTLTYSVVDQDGDTVTSGTPTATAGVLSFALTAAQAAVGTLTVTWGGLVFSGEPAVSLSTQVEVIGAWLFTIPEVRAAGIPQATYNDARILADRDRITEEFESSGFLGFPLGRRYFREVHNGDSRGPVILRQMKAGTLHSVETRSGTTWTALTADELAACYLESNGILTRENSYWPTGTQNIRVGYEAGMSPIPADLRTAGIDYLRHLTMNNNMQAQATAVNNEGGTFTIAKPGDKNYFVGLPAVDRVIANYRKKLPGIA